MTTEDVVEATGVLKSQVVKWAFNNKVKKTGRDYDYTQKDVEGIIARKGMRGKK